MISKLKHYALLLRLNKPIGIFLLLWPTLWALWIAGDGHPDKQIIAIFVLGVILMRSAGCAINDYADRDIDPHVQRTRLRPVAAGLVRPGEALALFAVLGFGAFALVLMTNTLTIYLSIVGAVLATIYPFMKRYTYVPQAFLGLAFGWAIPMAFAAQTGDVPKIAWLLLLANILWTTAYDTIYAMIDREDDLRIGVKSTAILFGQADIGVVRFLHVLFFATMVLLGRQMEFGWYYYGGLVVAGLSALYQLRLLGLRDETYYFRAFLHNNGFGAAIFAGIGLEYYFK